MSITFYDTNIYVQIATIFVTKQGLKVTVEDAKCVQANAFIQSAIFNHFLLTVDQATFKINLTVLIVSQYFHAINVSVFFLNTSSKTKDVNGSCCIMNTFNRDKYGFRYGFDNEISFIKHISDYFL